MTDFYIYAESNGAYLRSESGNSELIVYDLKEGEDFTFIETPDNTKTWRWVGSEWIELLPINNPDAPPDDVSVWDVEQGQWVLDDDLLAAKKIRNQALVWERIKAKRLAETTSGVYVPSVGKWLHTDEVSVMQYGQIGNTIALGVFQPLNWKAMDGDFIEMTDAVFRELQLRMIINTQTNYAKAEYHKYMMMQADDPLSYDFSGGWANQPTVNLKKADI